MSASDSPRADSPRARGTFPSREELLGGLPARRASMLLFAIESRTAQLVGRARRALLIDVSERSAAEQERSFLAALAGGREGRAAARVQDLDRYAPRWQDLVPDDPQLRAALSRLMLGKYAVPRTARRLLTALGLGDPAVVAAYEQLYGERPELAFAARQPATERLRWLRSNVADRLERMPPFWIAFALTLTETVGGGILALPIALAGFGTLGALAMLAVFGVVNIVTVAALCEAITRNGHMRYGTAYFGRLISDFLGRPGLFVLSIAFSAFLAVVLLMGLTGFGDVLAGATGLHPAIWAAGLFAVTMIVLARGSLDATVASAIVIGSISLLLLMVMAGIALAAGLAGGGPDGGAAVETGPAGSALAPETLALAFGVVAAAFFGHFSVGNAAKLVLTRDPGGRSLLWGAVLAMVTVIVVYAIVIVAFFSALDERLLVGHAGTVITPLAERVGPSIHVLGAIYASLALGLGTLYSALGLFNIAGEALDPLATLLGQTRRSILANRPARFIVRSAPAVAVFIVLEFLLLTGSASFSGPLGVVSTLTVPVLAGVFPMLMVAAARRRGDRLPATVLAIVGRAPVVALVWTLFVAGVLAHAVVWERPLDRLIAVAVAAGTVALTYVILRRGALAPGATLELRDDGHPDVAPQIALVARGRPAPVMTRPGEGGELSVDLPLIDVPTLRLWAHRVTADNSSEGLDVHARIVHRGEDAEGDGDREGDAGRAITLGPDGEATVPLRAQPVTVVFSGLAIPAGKAAPPRP